MPTENCLLACLSFELTAPTADVPEGYFLIFPEGETRSHDGRPHDVPAWQLDRQAGQALAGRLNESPNDMVIDYEHQTLSAAKNGQKAPAAGWLKAGQYEYVAGVGICNKAVSWTAAMQEHIDKKEYRFKSPVIVYDETGVVKNVINVAVTNTPALLNLDELSSLSAQLLTHPEHSEHPEKDRNMNELLKFIVTSLGLSETTTETEAVTALKTEMAKVAESAKNADVLIDADKPLAALSTSFDTVIAKAKAGGDDATPDPAKYVPIDAVVALNAQIALLQGNQKDEVGQLVQAALSDGRLLDAQKDWATSYGKQDLNGLKGYLDTAPTMTALTANQTTGKAEPSASDGMLGGKLTALTAEQKGVAVAMGLSEAEMLEQLNA